MSIFAPSMTFLSAIATVPPSWLILFLFCFFQMYGIDMILYQPTFDPLLGK